MSGKVRLYAVAFGLLLTQVAIAQTVSWSAGNPTTAKGTIKGQGTFAPAGWQAKAVTMTAIPTAGGGKQTAGGKLAVAPNYEWHGEKGGPIEITGLAAGQYTVYAEITFTKEGEQPKEVSSPVSTISVP